MNQHQRKFLLEQIEGIYKTEKSALNDRKPVAPSLNNYLIAAILDGTAVMRPSEHVRDTIRKRVRDLGKSKALTESGRDYDYGSRRGDETEEVIKLPALLLYEAPPAFTEVQTAYEAAAKQWEDERAALESSINAMRIKVQVGSDKALEALVDQADNICRMSLTASSRLLIPSTTDK